MPGDYPTIQAAIDAASRGDTVLVAPGTYKERIRIYAKEITVESTAGPEATVIDGSVRGIVALIYALPGESPVLRGFTLTNGYSSGDAGGVVAAGGPAIIENNIITHNFWGGVQISFAATILRDNVITDNWNASMGGGVLVIGNGTAQVLGNTIAGNTASSYMGGGIDLYAAGAAVVAGNTITGNSAGSGGGIHAGNATDAHIYNNLIAGNSAAWGGGISYEARAGRVTNNTIVGNTGRDGSAIYASVLSGELSFANNMVVGASVFPLVKCGFYGDPLDPPSFTNNNFVNRNGTRFGGTCADPTGTDGNLSVEPEFVDESAGDYHLQQGSPVIDAGRNDRAPSDDFDGDIRPFDGDGDGVATVDIGYDEYLPPDTAPPVLALPDTIGVDALMPSGAWVDFTVTAEDDRDGAVPVACSAASGSTFPIGDTAVGCEATDAAGNTATGSFTVHVRGATEQLEALQTAIAADLGPGSSLGDRIATILRFVAAGKTKQACDNLAAFDRSIWAQLGKSLTREEALDLLRRSQHVQAVLGCSVGAACAPPAAGLTGWWTADGTIGDRVGDNDAALVGDATFGLGLVSDAFALDGDGDYVDVADAPSVDVGTGDFTVSLWVRFNDTAGEQILVEKWVQRYDEPSSGWTLTKLDGDMIGFAVSGQYGGEVGIDSWPLTLRTNTWYHVAARRSGTELAVFVDGAQVTGGSLDPSFTWDLASTSSLKFGHRGGPDDTPGSQDESGFYLNGAGDEVQLYVGTALSDQEIGDIFRAGAAGTCKNG